MDFSDKTDYVGVWPGFGWIYVIVPDRAKFDMIERPVTDHGEKEDGSHVLTKSVGESLASETHGTVIFQHWIKTADSSATLNSSKVTA